MNPYNTSEIFGGQYNASIHYDAVCGVALFRVIWGYHIRKYCKQHKHG